MATQVQLRRGTTSETTVFIGADSEVTVDTTKKTCVVHDGSQSGGYPLLREDGSNSALLPGGLSSCSLKFLNDPNTGIISPGSDQIGFVTGGVSRLLIDSSGSVTIPGNVLVGGTVSGAIAFGNGTALIPSIQFTNDPDTGLYLSGTNSLSVTTNGVQRFTVDTTTIASTLPVSCPLGAAATPSITFTGDLNTGIYSPGADQVAISTNGTGRLFADASGNIGINTTPSSLGTSVTTLEVKGDSTTRSGGLRVSSSDSSVRGAFYIYDGAGVLGTESATPLDLYTGNSPRLRITSAGLVGVGTSAPQDKLAVVGVNGNFTEAAIRVNGSTGTTNSDSGLRLYANCNTSTKNWIIAANYGAANALEITPSTADGGATYSTPTAVFTSTGRVGVGTTSPLTKLEVRSGVITAGSVDSTNGAEILRGYYSNGALAVIGSEYSSGGPVIGCAVKPSTSAAGAFLSSTSGALERGAYTIAGNIHKWYIGANQTVAENSSVSTSEVMRIDSSGRVGIGTSSPVDRLHVDGRIAVSTDSSTPTTGEAFFYKSASGAVMSGFGATIETGSAGSRQARVSVDSTGRVGIGTTSPNSSLVVSNSGANGIEFGPINGDIFTYNRSTSAYTNTQITCNEFVVRTNGSNERARIDSSGRLLVGTSSTSTAATILAQGNSSIGSTGGGIIVLSRGEATPGSGVALGEIRFADNTHTNSASIQAYRDGGTWSGSSKPTLLAFSTTEDGASSPTERMRLGSGGFLKVSPTGNYFSATGSWHELHSYGSSPYLLYTAHAGASPTGIYINYSNATPPNNTSNEFLFCTDTNGSVLRASIRSNGGLANFQANNVNLSDINTKKDITSVADTWDCVKEWEIVNYRYKDQPDDSELNIGVIAQQVAESCPEVITVFQEAKAATESQLAQEERLGIKEQQMYWMAIKALQESMGRIEQLEIEMAAVKAQLA